MSNNGAKVAQNMSWLGLEAPRYTSYPAANHFSPEVGANRVRQWLGTIEDDTSVSVYVHIPFCRELCWFCGCHTKATTRYEPIAKYVRLLLREIELLRPHVAGRGKLVNIHFGGGSPSLLQNDDMTAILDAIASLFYEKAPGELAIELDPRTTTPENIALYAKLGFNRVSIGIQDFDPIVQQAINRVQPYAMVASVLDRLRRAGIDHINCDLIYGLPHQTIARFRDTLKKTITLNPTRIALFSYAHLPDFKKHQRMIDTATLPAETEKLALYTLACEMLEANGYVTIGIDHFAKADDPLAIAMRDHTMRRNFQGYVTDTTDVLMGIGCSSISQYPGGYVQNTADAVAYRKEVEAGRLPAQRGWSFVGEDILRKRVIDELMCFLSVDLGEIGREFDLEPGHFEDVLEILKGPDCRDVVAVEGESIRVVTPYRMAVRVIAAVFDQYRAGVEQRYSKVV